MSAAAARTGWAVLATGKIARLFAEDLALVPGAELVAVGSRRQDSAAAFAREYGGTPYGNYAAAVADPAVDVVYVASPHTLHAEHSRLALAAGKAVLCEKPLTPDRAGATALLEEARGRGLFCMEAMWMGCHPLIRAMLARLASGECGRAQQVVADLGFLVDAPVTDRLLDRALGAGALLDMGIYPLTLAHLVLGAPVTLRALAEVVDGVDHNTAVIGHYRDGALAAMTASMTATTPRTATIATDRGRFDLAADFHCPTTLTWTPTGGRAEPVTPVEPVLGRGYGNEAQEVQRCLAEGLLESSLAPHRQTLSLLGQMDEVRAQIGVRYPAAVGGTGPRSGVQDPGDAGKVR